MSGGLLEGLTTPGHRAVFIDDSELGDAPGYAKDVRILASVWTTSERYARVERAMTAELRRLGLAEFHAAEIANPKSGSPWSAFGRIERVEAMAFAADQLNSLEAEFRYSFCSKAQYAQLAQQARRFENVGVSFHNGLKRVHLRSVMDLIERPGLTSVVIDQDRGHDVPKLDLFEPAPELSGGGVIAAPSHLCVGIQLADLTAWSITRYTRFKKRFETRPREGFDEIAKAVLDQNSDRFSHILGEPLKVA